MGVAASAYKVLVCGAFATGKSTLLRHVAARLEENGRSFELLSGIPRLAPFPLNRDQTPLATAWLIGEQMRLEAEAISRGAQLLLCDRGIPDYLSHTTVLRPKTLDQQNLLSIIMAMGIQWARTYDVVFFAGSDANEPIDPAGGIRIPDKGYQRELEESILEVLRLCGIAPVHLPQRTADRSVVLLSWLEAYAF